MAFRSRLSCYQITINNTYDFAIGKSLKNLPELLQIGFAMNRRLFEIERIVMVAFSLKTPSRASTASPLVLGFVGGRLQARFGDHFSTGGS
jgi:hypothetical protein